MLLLPAVTGVISFPDSPFPYLGELWVIGYGSITQDPLAHSLLSLFSSIHPDYTSNGFSSQQPPTVMELCLNEQLCLSTSPLFSLSLLFLSFLTHTQAFPFSFVLNTTYWNPWKKTKALLFHIQSVFVVGSSWKESLSVYIHYVKHFIQE